MQDMSKADLKRRGWTYSQIRKFLGDPDYESPNPVNLDYRPRQMYAGERIRAAEATAAFRSDKLRVEDIRMYAGTEGTARKQRCMEWASSTPVSVGSLTADELVLAAHQWKDTSERFTPDSCPDRLLVSFTREFLEKGGIEWGDFDRTTLESFHGQTQRGAGYNEAVRILNARLYELGLALFSEREILAAAERVGRPTPTANICSCGGYLVYGMEVCFSHRPELVQEKPAVSGSDGGPRSRESLLAEGW